MIPFGASARYADSLLAVRALSDKQDEDVLGLLLESRSAWLTHCTREDKIAQSIQALQCTLFDVVAIFIHHDSQFVLQADAVHSQLSAWLTEGIQIVCTQLESTLEQISEGKVLTELLQLALKAASTPDLAPNSTISWTAALANALPYSGQLSNLWAGRLGPLFEQRAHTV